MKIKEQIFKRISSDNLQVDHLNIVGTVKTYQSDDYLKTFNGTSCLLIGIGYGLDVQLTEGDNKGKKLTLKFSEFNTEQFTDNDAMNRQIKNADFYKAHHEICQFFIKNSNLVDSSDYVIHKLLKIALDKNPDLIISLDLDKKLESFQALKIFKEELMQMIAEEEIKYSQSVSIKSHAEELVVYYGKVFDDIFNNLENSYIFQSKNKSKIKN